MNRTSRLWLACCLSLFACKSRELRLEGEVSVYSGEGQVKLGFADVRLISAEAMQAFLDARSQGKPGVPFPPEKFSVKSDHDGNFYLDVPPGSYAVRAEASRGTGGEEYRWLLWRTVDAQEPQPRLTLNHDNLAGSGCAECIVVPGDVRPSLQAAPSIPAATAPVSTNVPRELVVMGSLDKELIHKVVRANRGQIRYCYESQLMRAPSLKGTVAVKFVIASGGNVASASIAQSTVNHAELETCLTRRVQTWMFPKPKGGGVVIVTYPFRFAQG